MPKRRQKMLRGLRNWREMSDVSRPPAWSDAEDALMIKLRKTGATGRELYSAFEGRSYGAAKDHLKLLRRDGRVR